MNEKAHADRSHGSSDDGTQSEHAPPRPPQPTSQADKHKRDGNEPAGKHSPTTNRNQRPRSTNSAELSEPIEKHPQVSKDVNEPTTEHQDRTESTESKPSSKRPSQPHTPDDKKRKESQSEIEKEEVVQPPAPTQISHRESGKPSGQHKGEEEDVSPAPTKESGDDNDPQERSKPVAVEQDSHEAEQQSKPHSNAKPRPTNHGNKHGSGGNEKGSRQGDKTGESNKSGEDETENGDGAKGPAPTHQDEVMNQPTDSQYDFEFDFETTPPSPPAHKPAEDNKHRNAEDTPDHSTDHKQRRTEHNPPPASAPHHSTQHDSEPRKPTDEVGSDRTKRPPTNGGKHNATPQHNEPQSSTGQHQAHESKDEDSSAPKPVDTPRTDGQHPPHSTSTDSHHGPSPPPSQPVPRRFDKEDFEPAPSHAPPRPVQSHSEFEDDFDFDQPSSSVGSANMAAASHPPIPPKRDEFESDSEIHVSRPSCSTYTSCYSCVAQSHCGFCAASKSCLPGTRDGSEESACRGSWMFEECEVFIASAEQDHFTAANVPTNLSMLGGIGVVLIAVGFLYRRHLRLQGYSVVLPTQDDHDYPPILAGSSPPGSPVHLAVAPPPDAAAWGSDFLTNHSNIFPEDDEYDDQEAPPLRPSKKSDGVGELIDFLAMPAPSTPSLLARGGEEGAVVRSAGAIVTNEPNTAWADWDAEQW
eukprot:c17926_g1_i2.p1 GENE.c17926_g1_i2~~c17926_g1_i2.p1  ORF type:complete len:741 (+),score=139.57 c17926_g1_i2:141-2225(+)